MRLIFQRLSRASERRGLVWSKQRYSFYNHTHLGNQPLKAFAERHHLIIVENSSAQKQKIKKVIATQSYFKAEKENLNGK